VSPDLADRVTLIEMQHQRLALIFGQSFKRGTQKGLPRYKLLRVVTGFRRQRVVYLIAWPKK